jgi:hypothetical protein
MTFERELESASQKLDEFLDESNDHYGIGIGRNNPLWVAFCNTIDRAVKLAIDGADMALVNHLVDRAMVLREDRDARIHAARETLAEIREAING